MERSLSHVKRKEEGSCKNYIESLFLYHAAPVIGKVKASVLVTVKGENVGEWEKKHGELCESCALKAMKMKENGSSALYFIYDERALERTLEQEKSLPILSYYGYMEKISLDERLLHLKARFKNDEFPHEIGIFLDYPPEDVLEFIQNEGKNFKFCRYWKVYHNVEEAQKTFLKIDEARRLALEILESLIPIHLAVDKLGAS